jgi:hypothetical protein
MSGAASRISVINYPRHFAYLAAAAVVEFAALWSMERWPPPFLDGVDTHFALNGLLHSSAVVLALTARARWSRGVVFVAITAVLSVAAYYAGTLLETFVLPSAASQFIGALAFPSAVGAAAYWWLIRLFWIPRLTALSLLRTVVLCAAVTVAWEKLKPGWLPDSVDLMEHTLCWWLAFSLSLYVSERMGATVRR